MGIPLPALAIRPPAPVEDPLSQYGRVVALRKWASDVKRETIGIAQSIGIPFGISRIIRGGMSF
jgi:hypothetical protein